MHYYKIEFEIIKSHAEQALVLSKCLSIFFIYFSFFFFRIVESTCFALIVSM